jgi:ribosomal protein L11 methyltransferase
VLIELRPFIMTTQVWLEASLEADGEMVEAISEVMARYVSGGVVIESTQITDEKEGEGNATGLLRISGYLPVDDQLEDKKQKLLEGLWHLGQISPVPEVKFRPIADLDWSEVWKQHFQPVRIGENLVIIPTWLEGNHDQQIAIKIDPGMAFGTGTHPTTQLCLEIIADILEPLDVESRNSISIIDIGCGSGILGITAQKLGAGKSLGVDLDVEAVEAAHRNAEINGVEENLELGIGSLAEIKKGKFALSAGQIVIANILAPVITRLLMEGVGELVVPGGRLVLSGILVEQVPDIEQAIQSAGLKLVEKRQMGDWMALVAEH